MQGAPSEAPLNVFVRGDDMEALQRLNDEIVARIKAVPGAVDVDSSLESGQPEMVAEVNRAFAADMGFDVASVATQLRAMVEGVVPTRLRAGRQGVRHPRAAGPGVPERLPDHRPHAALLAAGLAGPHRRHRPDGVRRRPDQHPARGPAPPGQDRHRARRPAAGRRHRRCRGGDGGHPDAAELRVGLCRRRRADAGVRRGHGAGAAAGGGVHLHRAGVAVRVVPRAVPHHAVAAARHRRRAAGDSADRQQPRHAGDDRHGDADGPGHEERDPADRPHQPVRPRGAGGRRRHPQGGPDPAAARS